LHPPITNKIHANLGLRDVTLHPEEEETGWCFPWKTAPKKFVVADSVICLISK
jgi:hypothetical protein